MTELNNKKKGTYFSSFFLVMQLFRGHWGLVEIFLVMARGKKQLVL